MKAPRVQSPNAYLLESPEWLKEQYIDKNLSLKAVGALIPCSTLTVRRKMDKHGIAFHKEYGFGGNTKEQFDEYSSTTEVTY